MRTLRRRCRVSGRCPRLCEDCFATIDDEWLDVIDVEQLEDCENDEN